LFSKISKNGRFGLLFFSLGGGTDCHGVPLTDNTAKTSFGEDLMKIYPAVAKQSRQNVKNTVTKQQNAS